ncbi:MAG: methyltransferase domain-containing protein [Nanoarchaeota archaeon]|nr:methyltransferase domain-containing protein [Nanoarchaeota archaeon]
MYVKKLAVNKKNFVHHITDLNISFNSNDGGIDREILLKNNHEGIIQTTKGEPLLFCDATFKDNIQAMRKGAAVIIPKDIGFIIAECGLTKDSIILESGSGGGGATAHLAALCKHVYSYDINKNHLKTVQENLERLELDNVTLEECNIIDATPKEQVDLALIDLPEPTIAIPKIKEVVKQGGFIVFYTPQISQAQEVIGQLDEDFRVMRTIELIQRDWVVEEKKLRPSHQMLGHTAFLTIARIFRKE